MKRSLKLPLLIATLLISFSFSMLQANPIHLKNGTMSLVLSANKGEKLKQIYLGSPLSEADLNALLESHPRHHDAYPAFGLGIGSESALAVKHSDGNMTLNLLVESSTQERKAGQTIIRVTLKDEAYPFHVDVCYRVYNDVEVLETWTEIYHQEPGEVELRKFCSGYLPIRRGDVWLSHLYGTWASEAWLSQERLMPGTKSIKNADGVRNSLTEHAEIIFSLDGKPQENSGRHLGAVLCYSGNYKLLIDTDDTDYHHFYAGINEENSHYNLSNQERFVTPTLAITYSEDGLSGVSRNIHHWARSYKIAHGKELRKVLLNSWEGVYFDINEAGMEEMMRDLADLGGELFVMDDGWFGGKYQRNNDSTSLGDWVIDNRKLPHGLDHLISYAQQQGIRFGIWIEPEMCNTESELFEKHPEWVIKAPKRELITGRGGTQLILDLSNPEVQDYVFKIVDDLMTNYPQIDYIKWDANMSVSNFGSQYLPMESQSSLYIAYHRGFEEVCKRIRAKYPDVTIQACASGGGRANYGVLPYFDEFWVSDNTDALQRIYMQWGLSYFFPAVAMASHISAVPNHQTFRTIPLKFRIDVAMSGRLGMEMQSKHMTDEEKALCKKAIAEYKDIRPVVQQGEIFRLVSPYDNLGVASMMYCTPEKDRAVFYWWKMEHFVGEHLPRVKMAGLDPEKTYTIHELNRIDNTPLPFEGKSFSGAYLMSNGLEIPYRHRVDYHKQNDFASRVLLLKASK